MLKIFLEVETNTKIDVQKYLISREANFMYQRDYLQIKMNNDAFESHFYVIFRKCCSFRFV